MAIMGFFQKSSANPAASDIHLDASYRQDGFIRAVALSLTDQLISHQFNNIVIARTLVTHLKNNFPHSIPDAHHANAIETLQLMTKSPQEASRTTLELTWVLRQLMVDTICQSPRDYLPAFIDQGDIISSSELRKPGTYVNPVALQALAKAIHSQIGVRKSEPDKSISALHRYGSDENLIELSEFSGRYTAKIVHSDYFRPLKSITLTLPDPANLVNITDVSEKMVIQLLNNLQQQNTEASRWLQNMLADENLSVTDLLNLYAAHGPDMTWQKQFIPPSTELRKALINASAMMISFDLISRDDLFDEVQKTVSSPTMV